MLLVCWALSAKKDDSNNEEVMSQAATLNLAYSAANATNHNGGHQVGFRVVCVCVVCVCV